MILAILATIVGLALLVWSADWFVDGAAATAKHLQVPTLLIGMVVIGFGTSAPEMVVSALAAMEGNPGLALGNAYGSNIANIALVLGTVATLSVITVKASIVRSELPILLGVTVLSGYQLLDGEVSRLDAICLMVSFAVLMGWSIYRGMQSVKIEGEGQALLQDADVPNLTLSAAQLRLWGGLVLLVVSSRILVWGAVTIATGLGVSDLVIGLTIVAIGTSLPELASSITAVKKQEHDMALGNVLGSNLFNTLLVVGIAGSITPIMVDVKVLYRDWGLMALLTVVLWVLGMKHNGAGRIRRVHGMSFLLCYIAYMLWLGWEVLSVTE